MGAHDLPADPDSTSFGPFTLDRRRAALTRDGKPVALRPKTLALLSYFADHPGRVLDKQELLGAVWPGVVVTDDSLSQCVRELRTALGDQAEGLIRTVPRRGYVFEPAAEAPARTRAPLAWLGVGLAVLIAGGGLAAMALRHDAPVRIDEAIKARRSIAVLPFTEQGPDPRGYFAESVAEDLVTELSRLPDTLVIAQGSAAAAGADGPDVRTIGRKLGVRHVLLGTVRRNGAAVQINARFVSADDGAVLWSEQFSYANAAEWDWRRDIALRVARALDLQLTAAARQPVRSGRGLDAIDAVLEGQHLIRYLASRDDVLRARELFEAAVQKEPTSASAYTGLAHSHLAELEFYPPPDPAARAAQLKLAEDLVTKGQAADPNYPYAYCLRGHAARLRDDYEGALAVYERYLASYPSEAWVHVRLGEVKLLLGRPQEVAAHMARAMKLSPLENNLVLVAQMRAGAADFILGRDEQAYQRFREAAAAVATSPSPWSALAAVAALQGRQAEAEAHVQQYKRLRPDASIERWLQQTRPWRGDRMEAGTQRFVEGLRRAGVPQS